MFDLMRQVRTNPLFTYKNEKVNVCRQISKNKKVPVNLPNVNIIKDQAGLQVGIGVYIISTTAMVQGQKGIDVSHYQGNIDWAKVKKAGISFAVAKATEGSTYEDPTYIQNCQGMKNNNIKSGAYHYLRGAVAAKAQVAKILEVVGRCRPEVLVIDVEEGGNAGVSATQMADVLQGVLEGLKTSFSNIYIYTGPYYWEDKINWKKYDFSQYQLWIAHYTSKSTPTVPTTWKRRGYTWWQYTDKGTVDGINGPVDLDRSK